MMKAKALFNKQKRSNLAADHIKASCDGNLFVIPGPTRWNSVYDANKCLTKRLTKRDDSLETCNNLMGLLGLRKFTNDDVKFFKEYMKVYSHFANVLDVLQGEKDIYAGALLPILSGLTQKL